MQRNPLALLVRPEHQQILGGILVGTVLLNGGVFQLTAKGVEELLVVLPVVLQQGFQLLLDLLFKVTGNDGKLAVVLQHLTADIQGDILGIHHAADEAEVVGQQLLTVIHDHHTGGIKLQAAFEILGVVVIGRLAGDIQQCLEGHGSLGAGVNHPQGLVVVEELLPVEGLIFLIGHVLLVPLPDGHHGIDGFPFGVLFILRLLRLFGLLLPALGGFFLVLLLILFRLLHLAGFGNLHADGVADIIGILLNQISQLVLVQEFGVILVVGIWLQGHDDVGTGGIPLRRFNGIAVRTVAGPLPCGILAVFSGNHGDGRSHHKRGIESHAELADNVDIVLLLHFLLKVQRTGLADGAQILLHLFPGHTDAVIGHGDGAVVLVAGNGDGKIIPVQAHLVIGQGGVGQLVDGVGSVGDDLPQENLLMGVDGVDHQIQKPLGLRFELLLFHSAVSLLFIFSTLNN